ncbi:hypothetical protein QR680_012205 [Steinernema hermaphroditum]|uniref:Uncharacterized protein n=1 Tax=Steinernema hermaphroditum TaxID=289476 RepID=A0AA39I1B0_9BILA|nr:hypothetical protein QR680_012205 [Steinernema hermaphroditum]
MNEVCVTFIEAVLAQTHIRNSKKAASQDNLGELCVSLHAHGNTIVAFERNRESHDSYRPYTPSFNALASLELHGRWGQVASHFVQNNSFLSLMLFVSKKPGNLVHCMFRAYGQQLRGREYTTILATSNTFGEGKHEVIDFHVNQCDPPFGDQETGAINLKNKKEGAKLSNFLKSLQWKANPTIYFHGIEVMTPYLEKIVPGLVKRASNIYIAKSPCLLPRIATSSAVLTASTDLKVDVSCLEDITRSLEHLNVRNFCFTMDDKSKLEKDVIVFEELGNAWRRRAEKHLNQDTTIRLCVTDISKRIRKETAQFYVIKDGDYWASIAVNADYFWNIFLPDSHNMEITAVRRKQF